MTAEEYRALLDTDFSDADIEQLTDIRNIKIDKNLSQEKRQAVIKCLKKKRSGGIFKGYVL